MCLIIQDEASLCRIILAKRVGLAMRGAPAARSGCSLLVIGLVDSFSSIARALPHSDRSVDDRPAEHIFRSRRDARPFAQVIAQHTVARLAEPDVTRWA